MCLHQEMEQNACLETEVQMSCLWHWKVIETSAAVLRVMGQPRVRLLCGGSLIFRAPVTRFWQLSNNSYTRHHVTASNLIFMRSSIRDR